MKIFIKKEIYIKHNNRNFSNNPYFSDEDMNNTLMLSDTSLKTLHEKFNREPEELFDLNDLKN